MGWMNDNAGPCFQATTPGQLLQRIAPGRRPMLPAGPQDADARTPEELAAAPRGVRLRAVGQSAPSKAQWTRPGFVPSPVSNERYADLLKAMPADAAATVPQASLPSGPLPAPTADATPAAPTRPFAPMM